MIEQDRGSPQNLSICRVYWGYCSARAGLKKT